MKEESLLLLSDLQKLINQVVLIDYTIIILEVVNMCKAWDDHKKRGIQEGRYLEIYSLVQDGIIEPELGAKRLNMPFADFERAMQKAGYKLPEPV